MSEEIFPAAIAYRSVIETGYSTSIVSMPNGYEYRIPRTSYAKRRFEVDSIFKSISERDAFLRFFHALQGPFDTFRIRDWSDYLTTQTDGLLGTGLTGTGVPTYQLHKRYSYNTLTRDRRLLKLVSATIYRSASPVTVGVAPGNVAINLNTGVVTFVADETQTASSHSVGASHQVTLASALSGLVIGGKLYLSGVSGTAATLLNSIAHTITNIAGSTYTLSVTTTGLTATGGTGAKYPQPTETLSHVSEFHVPVRFENDVLRYNNESPELTSASDITMIEVLNP